jgi:hypothetical protein
VRGYLEEARKKSQSRMDKHMAYANGDNSQNPNQRSAGKKKKKKGLGKDDDEPTNFITRASRWVADKIN